MNESDLQEVASVDGLVAGAARRNLRVEPGLPGPGLRLWGDPFVGQESALTVGALVLTSTARTAVIVGTDLICFPDSMADRIREQAAAIAGTTREMVLLNASHGHAVPPLPGTAYSGDVNAVERFGDVVERTIAGAVRAAVRRRRPARLGAAFGTSPISVYRRARGADGRDHLGEVPGAPVDPAVGVLRVDALDGSAIAVLFSFGCHPVLFGPRTFRLSSDFPGVAREVVERNIGGTALFLQACSGDVNPRYGIGAEVDPSETVHREGTVLGAEVVRVASEIRTRHYRGAQTPLPGFGISLWPWEQVEGHAALTVAGAERRLDLPLSELPDLDTARKIKVAHHRELEALEVAEAPWRDRHIQRRWADWSDVLMAAVESGTRTVPVTIQALRIGEVAFAAVAMETFSATGLDIKARSPFAHTQLIGVSNGYHGYLPRAQDLPVGGWKATERYSVPDLYPQAWLQAAAIGPSAEQVVVEGCLTLLRSLV